MTVIDTMIVETGNKSLEIQRGNLGHGGVFHLLTWWKG